MRAFQELDTVSPAAACWMLAATSASLRSPACTLLRSEPDPSYAATPAPPDLRAAGRSRAGRPAHPARVHLPACRTAAAS